MKYAYKEIDGSEISESHFTYNGFGARTSETAQYDSSLTKTTTWTFDGSGNRLTQTHGDTTFTYTHDGLGRIKTIDKGENEIVYYAYIGKNTQSIDYTLANTSQSFDYDAVGRILRCQSTDPDSLPILDFIYTYDNVENRDSVKYNHLTTPVWDKYYYDTLNRLWKAEYGQSSGFSRMVDDGRLTIDDLVLFASAWLETTDYTDFTDFFATEKAEIHKGKNIGVHSRPSVVKEYSAAEIAQIKRRILSILRNVDDPHIAKLVDSITSVTPVAYNPDAALFTLVELGDEVPANYRGETCRDEDGNIIAQIIWDDQDRMVLFAMYPDSGGTILITTGYDTEGNVTSNTLISFDGNGNTLETIDLLAQQQWEAQMAAPTNYELNTMNFSSLEAESWELDAYTMMSSTPGSPTAASETFAYDHLGNRYQHTDKNGFASTYTHNPVNQYESLFVDYGFFSFWFENFVSYDNNGNLQYDADGYSYSYDYRNKLTEIEEVVQFKYDALGRRFYKKDLTTNTETYYFFDDSNRIIAQYVEPQSGTAELDRLFVYGNGLHEVLAMFLPEDEGSQSDVELLYGFFETWLADPNDGRYDDAYDYVDDGFIDLKDWAVMVDREWNLGTPHETQWYYLHDAQGSVMGLVGGRLNRPEDREFYTYDVYGTPSRTSAVGNPFMFHAKFVACASPLIYSRYYRDYKPDLGSWLQFEKLGVIPDDPMALNQFSPHNQYKDGANLYQMLHQNPTNNTDQWGLTSESDKTCCKIKTSTTSYVGAFGTVVPYTQTSCTQETISNTQGASPGQACRCHYKNQPNVEVYNWHEGECKWCDVYYSRTPDFLGFGTRTRGISHALVNVKCEKGKSWSVQVFPREVGLIAFWPHKVEIGVGDYIEQPNYDGGNLVARVSQEVADSWRMALAGQRVTYQFPFRECQQFALRVVNGMSEQCP